MIDKLEYSLIDFEGVRATSLYTLYCAMLAICDVHHDQNVFDSDLLLANRFHSARTRKL
jgi:hypothetical protein